MKPSIAFGSVLREMRLSRQMSQLELAEVARLDRTFVSLLERGERQPTITTIFELARALDVLPSALIEATEALVRVRKSRNIKIPSRRL